MRYYIADQHFYHRSLLTSMDKRPFSTVEEMNQYMIDQWNSRVKPDDEVIILGDFSMGNGLLTSQILLQLSGVKCLIVGNHDGKFLRDPNFDYSMFRWIKQYAEIRDGRRIVCLSHYPIMCYNGQYRKNKDGTPTHFMLYGHTHCTMDESLIRNYQINTMSTKRMSEYRSDPEEIPCNMINCFCMFSDYVPLTLDEWIDIRNSQLIIQDRINKRMKPPKQTLNTQGVNSHAHWMIKYDRTGADGFPIDAFICSNCNHKGSFDKYCQHCGALMDEEPTFPEKGYPPEDWRKLNIERWKNFWR